MGTAGGVRLFIDRPSSLEYELRELSRLVGRKFTGGGQLLGISELFPMVMHVVYEHTSWLLRRLLRISMNEEE